MSAIVSSLLVLILAVPLAAAAQERTPGDLRLGVERRRTVVLPRTPLDVVTEDAARVASGVTAQQRMSELAREATRPPLGRPDLDLAVRTGIQARNLSDVLRQR